VPDRVWIRGYPIEPRKGLLRHGLFQKRAKLFPTISLLKTYLQKGYSLLRGVGSDIIYVFLVNMLYVLWLTPRIIYIVQISPEVGF
jgi:hypothetical protein